MRLTEYAPAIIEAWGRPRIFIDGADFTFHAGGDGRDHATILGAITRVDPFTYGGASLVFPGFDAHTDKPGRGRWAGVRADAAVRITVVDRDNPEKETLYRGNIITTKPTPNGLEVVCEGRLFTANHQTVTPEPGAVKRELVEDYCARILNGASRGRFRWMTNDLGTPTGIYHSARGEYASPLAMVTDALSAAVTATGISYTIRYGEETGPAFTVQEPRNSWSLTYGQPGIEVDVLEDHRARLDAVYGAGTNSDGGAWRNTRYPGTGSNGEQAPPWRGGTSSYEAGSPVPETVGKLFWERMDDLGHRISSTSTTFHKDDADDVRNVQRDAGLDPSGKIDKATWEAVLSPGLDDDFYGDPIILPLASKRWVDKWVRTADGARLGLNAEFNQDRVPVERFVDFGDGVSRRDARRSAWQMLAREKDPLISGTVTLTADPREGSRFSMREGDEILVRNYYGETLRLHISELTIDVAALTVTATVANRTGTYTTIAGEMARNKEERQSRRASNGRSASGGPGVVWDAESPAGRLTSTAIPGGQGRIIRVPVPQRGEIVRSVLNANTPTEFVVGVFEKPTTIKDIETILGGNPLTIAKDPTAGKAKALKDAGLAIWWGSKDQPLGYGPKPPGTGETLPKTGEFSENANWDFRVPLAEKPYLYVAVWTVDTATYRGRFYPAADSD